MSAPDATGIDERHVYSGPRDFRFRMALEVADRVAEERDHTPAAPTLRQKIIYCVALSGWCRRTGEQ